MGEEDLLGRGVDVAGAACWLLGIAVVYFRCLYGFQFEYFRYWTLLVGEREFCAWEDFVDCMEMEPVSVDRGRNQSFCGWQNIDLRLHA